ncbi:antibiotic biosynthesis monooxygenase [Lacinutrix sp. 5H-3-7-4]|uniref:antibiotic biosynthesis monooxygenase family protein n=1 Tax=Lacinutrix sp. (strain 5H-3-7-4) TaxID=983544 RepID=UPI00020A35B2|nr:antibiotic biosynthesis monooxygenase [Lacinutrix sp. 5H-3-7-4]AEH00761.1 hypothetical protein Lacal_0913 [Lacinutrix sp. 5H-3-7-4]
MKNFKPYYAVIFTSTRTEGDNGYLEMAELMETLAKKQNGFISIDSARNEVGITVSYWENLEAIQLWKQQTDHVIAQQKGIKDWYSWYNVKICKVEREYTFQRMQE